MGLRTLQILGFILTLLWLLTGIIVVWSIYFETSLWEVNLIVGILFVIFSFFIYQKEKNFLIFIETSSLNHKDRCYKNMLLNKIISLSLLTIFSLIVFSGIVHRVFFEHFSVFG